MDWILYIGTLFIKELEITETLAATGFEVTAT